VSRNGEVKCESFIQYADYTWECPMPLLGGWKIYFAILYKYKALVNPVLIFLKKNNKYYWHYTTIVVLYNSRKTLNKK
jgi:hypothetical protein